MINPIVSVLSKALELNGQPIGISNLSTGTTNLDTKALVKYSNNVVITNDFFIQKNDELLFILNKEIPSNKFITFRGGVYKVGTVDNTIDGYYTHYTKYSDKATVYTITLQEKTLNVSTGKTIQIVPICRQNNIVIDNPVVTYTSLDNNIATVSSSGLVTGISEGTTTIKATYEGIVATCTITVVPVVYDIVLSEYLTTIKEKGTYQILPTCTIDTVVDISPIITYTSLNPTIATVSTDGIITGVLEGITSIISGYNGIEKSFILTIEKDVIISKPIQIVGSDTIKVGLSSTYNVENIDGSPLGLRSFTFEIDVDLPFCEIVSYTDTSVVLKALVKDENTILTATDKADISQSASLFIGVVR